jgi:hypothetical protein
MMIVATGCANPVSDLAQTAARPAICLINELAAHADGPRSRKLKAKP